MTAEGSSPCYFCSSTEEIEEHHIFPRRYGGGNSDSNLVTLCSECHLKIESLYDNSFFEDRCGLSKADNRPAWADEDDDVCGVWFEPTPDAMGKCPMCGRNGPYKAITLQPESLDGSKCCRCGTVMIQDETLDEGEVNLV